MSRRRHDAKLTADTNARRSNAAFLLCLGLLASFVTLVVNLTGSQLISGDSVEPKLSVSLLGWVLLQSVVVLSPALAIPLVALVAPSRNNRPCRINRPARIICQIWILLLPIASILNLLALGWIGQPVLSWETLDALPILAGLTPFLSPGVFAGAGLIALSIAAIVVVLPLLCGVITRAAKRRGIPLQWIMLGVVAFGLALAFPALVSWESTKQRMHLSPELHPFCMLRIVSGQSVGPRSATVSDHDTTDDETFSSRSKTNPPNMKAILRSRLRETRQLTLTNSTADAGRPDVLLVIVESFRRELVHAETMPNLKQLADRGILCRTHFSGGNATNHGIFSILTGMEAVWYDSDFRFSPTLTRLFRNAGYEVGFFAGDDDWRKFYMDGFINRDHFDVFDIRARDGMLSDRRTIENAAAFLKPRRDPGQSAAPRFAVVYLYATHAMYHSYAEDQVFEPAADDRFLYPYPSSARSRVWNRYRNSARSIDRLLATLYRDDLVTVVTGDHGEAFLEDTTIGHGIRISEYQNQTPAILYSPTLEPKIISDPTMHADLLPTLISLTGQTLSSESALDGKSLIDTPSQELQQRRFTTRNYLQPDVALIGPWTNDENLPYAYRGTISVPNSLVTALNPIDRRGFEILSPKESRRGTQLFRDWVGGLHSASVRNQESNLVGPQ